MKTVALGVVVAALFGASAVAAVRQEQEMPKPGKEHELLKQFEGEFDVAAKFWMDPAKDPMESKGSEKSRVAYGGFWLVSEYTGDMMGQKFEGIGTLGYSPFKKKYVGTWVDSMMPHIFSSEGEVDKDGKVWTFTADSIDPMTGQPCKEKWVSHLKDKDTKVMTFYAIKDGKDVKTGEITYTRKKK